VITFQYINIGTIKGINYSSTWEDEILLGYTQVDTTIRVFHLINTNKKVEPS